MLKSFFNNRKYWAIAGSVILLIICYELSFNITVQAYRNNQNLKSKSLSIVDLSIQPGAIDKRLKSLNQLLDRYRSDSISIRAHNLTLISVVAKKYNVQLAEVSADDPLYHNEQFILERLNFTGTYFALLGTLNSLAVIPGIGIIRSVSITVPRKNQLKDTEGKIAMELFLECVK